MNKFVQTIRVVTVIRTPRGQQRCRLCSELFEEGAAYLDHVDECLRKRRQRDGKDSKYQAAICSTFSLTDFSFDLQYICSTFSLTNFSFDLQYNFSG